MSSITSYVGDVVSVFAQPLEYAFAVMICFAVITKIISMVRSKNT